MSTKNKLSSADIQATPVPHTAHKPPPLTLTPSPRSLPLPHNLTAPDAERSASTRLQPDEKRELHKLLKKYVPLEVIRNSKIWNKFSCVQSLRLTKSTEYMEDTTTERDAGSGSKRRGLGSELHEKPKHRSASMSKLGEKREEDEEVEWVVLDESSVTDSGTCCSSDSSQDENRSLDIDIGDFSLDQCK